MVTNTVEHSGNLEYFYLLAIKINTTGGGGARLCTNAHLIQHARHLASPAREDFSHYEHLEIGYNYKINNLSASIGLAQLEQLDSWVESRQTVNEKYRKLLKDVEGINSQTEEIGSKSNFW
jgi:dTDP-4-amino-4,6-dideoxygalactose transaminase